MTYCVAHYIMSSDNTKRHTLLKGGDGLEDKELFTGMVMELRRGTVVLCALCKLKEPMYGYNLLGEISECGIPVEANTLYPLLRRLESQGLLVSEWNTQEAKPRKYYRTTPFGDEICKKLTEQWNQMSESMKRVIEERN